MNDLTALSLSFLICNDRVRMKTMYAKQKHSARHIWKLNTRQGPPLSPGAHRPAEASRPSGTPPPAKGQPPP